MQPPEDRCACAAVPSVIMPAEGPTRVDYNEDVLWLHQRCWDFWVHLSDAPLQARVVTDVPAACSNESLPSNLSKNHRGAVQTAVLHWATGLTATAILLQG